MSTTLTMESFADPRPQGVAAVTNAQSEGTTLVGAITKHKSLENLLKLMLDRIDKLEGS